MTQSKLAHIEAAVNTLAGLAIAQLLLALWGMRFTEAAGLNGAFLAVSYIRMYAIRRVFSAWRRK